jgi:hemerythrin superfamily protein
MATPHSSTSKRKASASRSRAAPKRASSSTRQKDAIQLLKADHREVEKLFGQFEKSSGRARKLQLARKICLELKIHTQIEEEIFYPAARDVLKDDDILNEALVEHQAAKDLIAQIEVMDGAEEMFEAKVTVLREQIEHHVGEEEKELFPQLQKSDMDLKGLGEQLAMRKTDLMAQMQGDGMEMH